MELLRSDVMVVTPDVGLIPAVLKTMLTSKGLDWNVFYVAWFCGFENEVVKSLESDMDTLHCKNCPDADSLATIVRVQQLARQFGLQQRQVLVVLNGDVFGDDEIAEVFPHAKDFLDIFPVLVSRHAHTIKKADQCKTSSLMERDTLEKKNDDENARQVIMPANAKPKRSKRVQNRKTAPTDE